MSFSDRLYHKIRQSLALSVIGRPDNSVGEPVDIAASAEEQVLTRRSSKLQFASTGGFMGRRESGTLTLTNAAYTTVTFDVEDYDDDTAFVHTTGIYTVPRTGHYLFTGACSAPNIDDGERALTALFVNGSQSLEGDSIWSPAADSTLRSHISAVIKLTAGDTVDMRFQHNEGADQTAGTTRGQTWFSGVQIR